jgi:hypothetical protein
LLHAFRPDDDGECEHGHSDSCDGAKRQPDQHTSRKADPPDLLKPPRAEYRSARDCDEQA